MDEEFWRLGKNQTTGNSAITEMMLEIFMPHINGIYIYNSALNRKKSF